MYTALEDYKPVIICVHCCQIPSFMPRLAINGDIDSQIYGSSAHKAKDNTFTLLAKSGNKVCYPLYHAKANLVEFPSKVKAIHVFTFLPLWKATFFFSFFSFSGRCGLVQLMASDFFSPFHDGSEREIERGKKLNIKRKKKERERGTQKQIKRLKEISKNER